MKLTELIGAAQLALAEHGEMEVELRCRDSQQHEVDTAQVESTLRNFPENVFVIS